MPSNLGAVAPVMGGSQAVKPRKVISAKTANAMASRASDGTPRSSDRLTCMGATSAADSLHQDRVFDPASRRDDFLHGGTNLGTLPDSPAQSFARQTR